MPQPVNDLQADLEKAGRSAADKAFQALIREDATGTHVYGLRVPVPDDDHGRVVEFRVRVAPSSVLEAEDAAGG